MYESFFQLSRRPFAAAPRIDQFYPARSIQSARQSLARCIARVEGVGLLVGPSGTGKTLVCRSLADEFRASLAVVSLGCGRLSTRRSLLQAILYGLGVPYRGLREGELRLALLDRLADAAQCPGGLLLLVDEAHTLPLRLLEELRLITNVTLDGQPRVRLVLAGGRALEERLASPKLEAFSQRIAARSYLEPLDREETLAYVRAQLAAAGGGEIFDENALSAVFHATDGVPRLINQVCDHALLLACAGGKHTITAAGVEEAWADLQQLPTPFNEPSTQAGPVADVIEFGPLDDATSAPSSAPSLRLAGHLDQGTADPDKWLDQIEDDLSTLDDDFEPAGTIGPEVELSFPQAADPFAEAFDDEEVVLDWCAGPGAPAWSSSPLVSCREGRVISALMANYGGAQPPPSWAKPARPRVLGREAAPPADDAELSYDPVLPEEPCLRPVAGSQMANEAADFAGIARPLAMASSKATGGLGGAVMVVEDDPHDASPPGGKRRQPTQPRQYGQLFARLLRG